MMRPLLAALVFGACSGPPDEPEPAPEVVYTEVKVPFHVGSRKNPAQHQPPTLDTLKQAMSEAGVHLIRVEPTPCDHDGCAAFSGQLVVPARQRAEASRVWIEVQAKEAAARNQWLTRVPISYGRQCEPLPEGSPSWDDILARLEGEKIPIYGTLSLSRCSSCRCPKVSSQLEVDAANGPRATEVIRDLLRKTSTE